MKTTNTFITEVTYEQMLADEKNSSYNPSIWKERINELFQKYEAKFYIAKKDDFYSYDRFYISYSIDGLLFFKEFSAFSSMLSNSGFKRVFIINGEIFTNGFGEDCNHVIVNNPKGREFLRENVCKYGVMVSNSF